MAKNKTMWTIVHKDEDNDLSASLYNTEKACRKAYKKFRKVLLNLYGINEDELKLKAQEVDKSKDIVTADEMNITIGNYTIFDEESCFSIYDNEKQVEHLMEIGELPIQTEKDIIDE